MKVTIHGEEEESVDVDLQEHVHDHAEHHEHANNHHEHCHDHEAAGNHHHHETEAHHHEMAADMADNTHIHAYDHDHQPDHDHHDEHDFHHTHTHEETHTEEDSGHPHHHHASMAGISHIIEHLNLPDEVKKDVVAVYHLIAEAESHVHGKTVEEIHFHEVGTADAIADIAGVCLLMHMIAPQKVIASPIHVGSGNVRCAHGILYLTGTSDLQRYDQRRTLHADGRSALKTFRDRIPGNAGDADIRDRLWYGKERL